MDDIERNYRAAASAYQAQEPSYLRAERGRRLGTISEGDYSRACNAHTDLQRALEHAEAAWVNSWRG